MVGFEATAVIVLISGWILAGVLGFMLWAVYRLESPLPPDLQSKQNL